MKSYLVPIGRLDDWKHPHPERTAYKQVGTSVFDLNYRCQVWTNRPAMLQACKMSDTGELGNRPWKPLVKP